MGMSPRIAALDGVRGLAILGVLAYHATVYSPRTDLGALDKIVEAVAARGATGVDLFFVLSGFLITGVLVDARGTESYFSRFFTRRVLRIFPLYYAALAFVFFILPIVSPHDGQTRRDLAEHSPLWFLLYGFNVLAFLRDSWPPGVLGHTWSLAVEEQFYLAWPFIVRFVPMRRLPDALLATVLLGVGIRVGLAAAGASGLALFMFPFARVDSFAIGGLVALALRGALPLSIRRLPLVLLAIAAPLLLARIAWKGQVAHALCDVLVYSLAYGALVAFAASRRVAPLEWRPLREIGQYSYAIYLVHPLIWHALRIPFAELLAPLALSPAPTWGLNFLVLTASSFAVALVTWHLIEKRFLAMKPLEWFRPAPALDG